MDLRAAHWCAALLTGAALLSSHPAKADPDKMAPDLLNQVRQRPNSAAKVRVIAILYDGTNPGAIARLNGGKLVCSHSLTHDAVISLPLKRVAALARNRNVWWVCPDRTV